MKQVFGIMSIILMVILAGSIFAQEPMEKMEKMEAEVTAPMGQGMMGNQGMMNMMPMMQKMMSGGMMGEGMMCPMCGKMMGGTGKNPDLLALADKLDLSKEQMSEIKDILMAHKKDMIRKKADHDIEELELSELTQKDELNLDAIETKLKDIAGLKAGMKFSEIKALADTKSILTNEQKAALKKIMKEKGNSMMGQKKVEGTETNMPGPSGHLEHH